MRSTQYIIGFAAAVCLVCGVVVAGSYESLKERQEINAQLDKKKKVLGVVSLYTAGEDITPEEIDKRFADNIQAKLVDLSTGQYADASEEEIAAFDQRKARQDPARSKAADAVVPFCIAKASARPMTMQFVMMRPTNTESCLEMS